MAKESAITWTKSTFNPWIGCTKVGPGCDHCYAEVSTPARSMKIKWGAGQPRYRTSFSNWMQPLKWNRQAPHNVFAGRKGYWPVFCASLADVFDNDVPQEWREDLWDLIDATPNLSWLLVTKRIGNVMAMIPARWFLGAPKNVRIIITVVNQAEADRDIPKLLSMNVKNGISYEPALGPVDWCEVLGMFWNSTMGCFDSYGAAMNPNRLEWVIVGGESSQGGAAARPFVLGWAKDTVRQCQAAGVPVFVKQLGSNPTNREGVPHPQVERAGADPTEWPEVLRVQEFPLC